MVVDEKAIVNQDVTTSDAEPKTSQETQAYSKEQVDKLMEKVRSDSLAELGRVRKAAEDAIKKSTDAATARYQELIKQRELEELENAKDEPDKLAVIKERQLRRQKEAELAKAQEELNEKNARLQELSTKDAETSRGNVSREIAERLKVDPAKLAKLAKFTDGSAEAIEDIAKDLPKLNPTPTRNVNLRPDSNDAAGGTGKTKTQIQEDYVKGKINNIQYAEQMKAHGYTP
jgi:hypothetical protein